MDAAHTSYELISHFDRSAALGPPPSAAVLPTRGVRWVFKWAAAMGVLFIATGALAEFAYVADAEHALALAARAALVEATLPRASCDSVNATIERRLESYPGLSKRLRLSLLQNSAPVQHNLQPRAGDTFSIVLTADSGAALPSWLKAIRFWQSGAQLQVHAKQRLPSRHLAKVE